MGALSHTTHCSRASLPCIPQSPARDVGTVCQPAPTGPKSRQQRIHRHLTAQTDLVYRLKAVMISKTFYYPAQCCSVPQTIKIPPISSNSPLPIPSFQAQQRHFIIWQWKPWHPPCQPHRAAAFSSEWLINYRMPKGKAAGRRQECRHLPTPQHLALCPRTAARLRHVRRACAEMGHELCTSEAAPDF